MFDEFLAQKHFMSQLSNHLVAERLAFVGCQSQMVPKLLFLWRWFRGCAPHNLHRTVAWECCLGEARWWKMGHETTLDVWQNKHSGKNISMNQFLFPKTKKKCRSLDWRVIYLPSISQKKITSSDGPLWNPSKRPLANVDQVIHPDRYLQTCTNKTTERHNPRLVKHGEFFAPENQGSSETPKKIPLADGLQILIVYHWDFATMISVVLLKHGPSSFPTPPNKDLHQPMEFLSPSLWGPQLATNGRCISNNSQWILPAFFLFKNNPIEPHPSEGKRRWSGNEGVSGKGRNGKSLRLHLAWVFCDQNIFQLPKKNTSSLPVKNHHPKEYWGKKSRKIYQPTLQANKNPGKHQHLLPHPKQHLGR